MRTEEQITQQITEIEAQVEQRLKVLQESDPVLREQLGVLNALRWSLTQEIEDESNDGEGEGSGGEVSEKETG